MSLIIQASELFDAMPDRVLLDVRTPAEYAEGHIPGALNLPLFSNEERAEVGTLYKQVSPEKAFLRGLDFAGARMRWYVETAMRLAPAKKIIVHCWRGGQRSGSLAWLLRSAGFDVVTVVGGYKAYRQFIHEQMALPLFQLVILGGYTGSAKTEILKKIKESNQQVVDLELIAHHKGSSFGALGEAPQPTVEQFENDLYEALRAIPPGARLWLEDESRSIGRVYIPDAFWRQMLRAPVIKLDMPFERRVNHLVEVYAHYQPDELDAAFRRIEKRLGGQHLKEALEALHQLDYATAAAIALRYYDKAYQMTIDKKTEARIIPFQVQDESLEQIAASLITFADQI